MSVGVGMIFETVCLSVCLSVCPQHNAKTNDPKVFKLGVGMTLGYPRSNTVLGIQRSKVKVTWSHYTIFRTTIAFYSHSLGGDTSTIT